MSAAIRSAVELAERQLAALRSGDVDDFLAGLASYESACLALAELSLPEGAVDETRRLLDQLIAVDRLVFAELDREMGLVSVRLASMRRSRNAAGAYLSSVPSAVTGVREG